MEQFLREFFYVLYTIFLCNNFLIVCLPSVVHPGVIFLIRATQELSSLVLERLYEMNVKTVWNIGFLQNFHMRTHIHNDTRCFLSFHEISTFAVLCMNFRG